MRLALTVIVAWAWAADVSAQCVGQPNGTPCSDGLYCTTNDTCQSQVCTGSTLDCDDGLDCTVDACNETTDTCDRTVQITRCLIDGACYMWGDPNTLNPACQVCDAATTRTAWTALVGYACDDGLFCSVADTCDETGTCVGLPRACGDTFSCTTDSCNEETSACDSIVAADQCLIGGACYAEGESSPTNTCWVCDRSCAAQVWCAATGKSCDDGLFCTIDDACLTDAACEGRPRVCDDGLSCTRDSCNETADSCDFVLQADACVIDELCYPAGVVNPRNACETCDPAVDASGWTALQGAACDDARFCTVQDACDGEGVCTGAPRTCDDGDTCTRDTCVEGLARCENAPTDVSCWIDGACVADGVVSPANACLACDPATSERSWTTRTGLACDDGLHCTVGDECSSAGACVGSLDTCEDGLPCTLDRCDEVTAACEHILLPGTCLIEVRCYALGQVNPDDADEVCDPGNDAGWSPRASAPGASYPSDSGCRATGDRAADAATTLLLIGLALLRLGARSRRV